MTTPVRIFIVYARKDKEQLELLKKHLRPLVQRGHVKVWYDGELVPGEHWEIKIKSELYNAHLVLLVVSVEYFDSKYIQEKELHIVKEREAKKRTHVVPILLSPCLWKTDPFLAKLQFLPSDARPVLASGWFDANEAWANVAEGIANVVLPKVKEMREENRVNDELRWEALRKGRNRFALSAYLNDYHKLNRTDQGELHLHHADSLLGEIRSAVRHLRAVRRAAPSNHPSLERKYYVEPNTNVAPVAGTQTFGFTGGQQIWTVPVGVTSIQVDVQGAQGGKSGGNGARTLSTLSVTPGQVLNIFVGGQGGQQGGGYNGGGTAGNGVSVNDAGGGGGASDIRIGGIGLGNRVVIAGGGGGTGGWAGGAGGAAGQNGNGGGNGQAGGGGGGGQAAGGGGGFGNGVGAGGGGGLGQGGNGSSGQAAGGGGGGGGYYGGGGGGGDVDNCCADGGGGGGGSSFSSGTGTTFSSGFRSGNGQIVINFNTSGIPGYLSVGAPVPVIQPVATARLKEVVWKKIAAKKKAAVALAAKQKAEAEEAALAANPKTIFAQTIPVMDTEPQVKIFIMYSRKDMHHKDRFLDFLDPHKEDEGFEVWHDGEIEGGENWDAVIREQLKVADIVFCLISADFLRSPYIKGTELKEVRGRYDSGHCKLVPILVGPCTLPQSHVLSNLQAWPQSPTTMALIPVSSPEWYHVDIAWDWIIKKIIDKGGLLSKVRDTNGKMPSQKESEAAVPIGSPVLPITVPVKPPRSGQPPVQATLPYQDTKPKKEKESRFSLIVLISSLAGILLALGMGYVYGPTLQRDSDGVPDMPPKPTGTYTETVNGVSFTMVAIPGGTFTMGDLFGEGEDNEKQHQVTLNGYHLGETEVTQALWRAVMGTNPSDFIGCAQCPVEDVSWENVVAFIGKLNQLATSGHTYRMPTEAEWEYAAREGGKEVRFGNGSNEANPAQMNFDCRADYKEPYSVVGVWRGKTTPVKTFSPNALGLYDMAGSVEEWCDDWYGAYGGAATNPKGPNTGSNRVFRGGSWANYPQYCRAAFRNNLTPGDRNSSIGLRLASQ